MRNCVIGILAVLAVTVMLERRAQAVLSATGASVIITVDTSLAEYALALACTGHDPDEARVRASPIVQAQIAHNLGILPAATMDAYVAALKGLSACRPPTPDVFRAGAILDHLDIYRQKIAALRARQSELATSVAGRLTPYVPAGTQFHRAVVLAVPYFSCGGFERGEYFFIDIGCLDDDIAKDFVALEVLVAHETFHGLQARIFHPILQDADQVTDVSTGLEYLFDRLLWEGTAVYVSGASELSDVHNGGPFTRLTQQYVRDNAARVSSNFKLLTILLAYTAAAPAGQAPARAEAAEKIAFNGGSSFEEFGYHVGARMAGDIERAWGRAALVCVMQLPPEQFVLAHDAVAGAAPKLGPEAVAAAGSVAVTRRGNHSFARCHESK